MDKVQLQSRTKNFALRVFNMVEKLPKLKGTEVIVYQLIKASTSVAANYRAACRAKSRADFINKLKKEFTMYRYLYCITKALHKPLNDVAGLEDAVVRTLQYGEIMAVVSEVTLKKMPISGENALRHEAVVEAVQGEQTVLPMRFSSVFQDDTSALEFLKNRYAVFVSDLERLHGTREMGIRIMMNTSVQNKDVESSPKSPPFSFVKRWRDRLLKRGHAYSLIFENKDDEELFEEKCSLNPGIGYLQQKRAYYASLDENDAHVQEIVKTCHAQFEDICVEFKRDTHASFSQDVSLNCLIHKDSLEEFKGRFNDLRDSLHELRFLSSGPWPPYHFVSSER